MDIEEGKMYAFQLKHWSPVNWKVVFIKYYGTKYIIMQDTRLDEEYCVDYVNCDEDRKPIFKEEK